MKLSKKIFLFPRSRLKADILDAIADGRILAMKKKGEQILAGGRGSNTQAAIQKSVLEKNIANFWTNVKWENNKAKMIYESDTPILSPMELAFQKAGYFDQTGQEQYMQKEEKDAEKQSMLKVKDGRMFSIPADSNVSKPEINTPETGNSDLFSDIHFQATERVKNGPQRTVAKAHENGEESNVLRA